MSKQEILRQVLLTRKSPSGQQKMRCLLDERSDLQVGKAITLKDSDDPDQWWEVEWIGQPVERKFVHRTWENNI